MPRVAVLMACLIGLAACGPAPQVWGEPEIVSDEPGGFRSIKVAHLPSVNSEYSLFLTCRLTPGLGAEHGLEIAYNGRDYQWLFGSAFGEHDVYIRIGSESETETWTSTYLEELRGQEKSYAPSFRSGLLSSAAYRMVLEEPGALSVVMYGNSSSTLGGDTSRADVVLFQREFSTQGVGEVFENLNGGPCRENGTKASVQDRWMHRDEWLVDGDLGFLSVWKHASEAYPEEIFLTAELAPDASRTIPTNSTDLMSTDERLELTCYLGWRETKPDGDRRTILRVHLNHALPANALSSFPDELTLSLDGSYRSIVAAVHLDGPAKLDRVGPDDEIELEMILVGSDPVTRSQAGQLVDSRRD